MGEHFASLSAVFPLILKQEEDGIRILLHRRQNTGYEDGKWDIAASGHVDKGETAREAVVRECMEEIGIQVRIEDLSFAHLSHRLSKDRTYYDIYFVVNHYNGAPSIMEPDKCSELGWFAVDKLPCDTIDNRKQDIQNYLTREPYSEKVER